MSQTITKHIGEGFARGELYAALAYDSTDQFGGMKIKALMLNSTGRISFLDANAYIYSSATTVLDICATTINITGSTVTAFTYPVTITQTNPTSATNGIYSLINAGSDWTTGSLAAIRGKAVSTTTTLTSGNIYGGWFGLMLDTNFAGEGLGLSCGIYANVDTANTVSTVPSAVAYFEIASGTGADYANMPILVLADGSTSQSNYALSLGFAPAGNTVSATNSSDILYHQTIHIMANGSDAYIPYSTGAGTYTTAYPIVSTSYQTITNTGPTSATNAFYSLVTADAAWTTGSIAAVRGRTNVTMTGAGGNVYGGWFAIKFVSGAPTGLGLSTGLYAEAGSDITGIKVSSVLQACLIGNKDMTAVPILVLQDNVTGTQTNILMEVGFAAGASTVSSGADATTKVLRTGGNAATNIQNKQGLHVRVNGAYYYIPLIADGDWQDD